MSQQQGRIRTSHQRGERIPKHIFTDHDWIRANQEKLIEQYGECYMIVYQEEVLGTGKTPEVAIEKAEDNLPESIEEIEVMVEWVGKRYRISRSRSKQVSGAKAEE